jgi:hypothetical protein
MPRPYGDPVEIVTAPTSSQSPFIPADAKLVVGAIAPASPDPIPIVLLPGFEYRTRQWRHPDTHEVHSSAAASAAGDVTDRWPSGFRRVNREGELGELPPALGRVRLDQRQVVAKAVDEPLGGARLRPVVVRRHEAATRSSVLRVAFNIGR